jgi:hypothetical protein
MPAELSKLLLVIFIAIGPVALQPFKVKAFVFLFLPVDLACTVRLPIVKSQI